MTASEDPLVGRTIAQYQVVARVGGGAMGVVYQARDTRLGRLVALKFLPQQWSHDETAKQRFVREAQAASATNHPNICTIHDIETADDGQLFIVMAFYEGQTLKQRLESGPMAIEEALEIATGIADGLAKAHAQGVVHRDIKPGNVMVTEEGPRILDFGLATFVDALKLTAENTSFGTPAYMSPAQVRGQTADARADVWAVGVVLYEMLAGHVPFQGAYAEAVAHAILHESPAPLRGQRPDIPEEIEQLVFRALHKDPNVRYQSGRELARAIRQMRGLSVPLELRSAPVVAPLIGLSGQGPSGTRRWRLLVGTALATAVVALVLWWFRPALRTPIVVAPVVNQTGYPALDAYRLALTLKLVRELTDSPNVAVLPWNETLDFVRGAMASGADPSSGGLMQAAVEATPDARLVVPTILYERGLWRGRVDVQDAKTGARLTMFETPERASSLPKDVADALAGELAEWLLEHFAEGWRAAAYRADPDRHRFASLDAIRHYEEGMRAFEELEYVRARASFTAAAEADPRNPLPHAWLSRVLQSMGKANEARDAGERANGLINKNMSRVDRLFVAAVVAESRRDAPAATARYQELAERFGGEPHWLMELGASFDRGGDYEQSVIAYQQALVQRQLLVRPHLELCRLYSPSRLNDTARAEEQGRRALAEYSRRGDRALEAQSLFCLIDVLRVGDAFKREEAVRSAREALRLLEGLGSHEYNVARAHNYIALAAEAQGDFETAVASWERALTGARATGNVILEPLVLMNLGVAQESMGNRTRALDYHKQSIAVYERLGDEERAAQHLANVGSLLIEYAGQPEQGARDVQTALTVFRAGKNKDFEAYCLRVLGWYHRNAGRYAESERLFNEALSIARVNGFLNEVAPITVDLARLRLAAGDYTGARDFLTDILAKGAGHDEAEARIVLAASQVRLGRLDAASEELERARDEVETMRPALRPAFELVLGDAAVSSGRVDLARAHFARASALWVDAIPDPASVEARAHMGLLTRGPSRAALESSLAQAQAIGSVVLEARVRILTARKLVESGDGPGAVKVLSSLPRDEAIGPELNAQAHFWRGQALTRGGDGAAGQREVALARDLIEKFRMSLPEPDRKPFASRVEIRRILDSQERSE
jgi:tetratricopeptide (TPR) repeat protein